MKRRKIILLSIIINLILIVIIYNLINKVNINNKKKIIKEMTENEQVTNLQIQINNLQTSHTEYANYIETGKDKIATAITERGIETSKEDTFEVMASNIKSIINIDETSLKGYILYKQSAPPAVSGSESFLYSFNTLEKYIVEEKNGTSINLIVKEDFIAAEIYVTSFQQYNVSSNMSVLVNGNTIINTSGYSTNYLFKKGDIITFSNSSVWSDVGFAGSVMIIM